MLAVSMLGLWSCGDDKTEDKIAVQSVTVQPTEATLEVGQALTLEVSHPARKGHRRPYSLQQRQHPSGNRQRRWRHRCHCRRLGHDYRKGGKQNRSVPRDGKRKTVAVESVTLDKTEASLQIGETITLTATVLPENATDKTVAWSSSDTSVATVDNDGKVTAIKAGDAKIIASVGDIKAECAVTVNEATVEVESVAISEKEINMTVGDNTRLTATVMPENATDTAVVWSSSNENVVAVDKDGRLTALVGRHRRDFRLGRRTERHMYRYRKRKDNRH